MQSSFNREAFERKISQIYESLEINDFKKAMRSINTLMDKAKKSRPELLFIRVTKAYVLDKQNKIMEAAKEVDQIIEEIKNNNIIDKHLIDQSEMLLREMGMFNKLLTVLEELHKKNPKEKQLAEYLFNAYCQTNNFFKMNLMAKKLETTFGKKEYGLYAIPCLYLHSKEKDASPMTLDLALMVL